MSNNALALPVHIEPLWVSDDDCRVRIEHAREECNLLLDGKRVEPACNFPVRRADDRVRLRQRRLICG